MQRLAQYAKNHGSTLEAFVNAGWKETTWRDKNTGNCYPAFSFPTNGGVRYRILEGADKFSGKGNKQCWYRLREAIELTTKDPLIIANGEASVVAAQSRGLPATAVTQGEKSRIPPELVTELKAVYPHKEVFIVFDNDSTGNANAPKIAAQLYKEGFRVCYLIWPTDLTEHYDLADWLRDNPDGNFYDYFNKHGTSYYEYVPDEKELEELTSDGTVANDWNAYFIAVLEKLSYERIGSEIFGADIVYQSNGELRYDNAGLGNLDIETETGCWHSWRDEDVKGRGPIGLIQLALFREDYRQRDKAQKAKAIQKIAELTGITPPQSKAVVAQTITIGKNLSTKDFALLIAQLGYHCRYNNMNDDIEIDGHILTDRILNRVCADMYDVGIKSKSDVELGLSRLSEANSYHPIKEYLNNLVWNGTDVIREVAQCLEGDTPDVTYTFLKRWFISVVAKTLDEKQNVMLVLNGPQGIGKSTFTKWLASGLGEQYYLDQKLNLEDKDIQVRAMSVWIWEIGELGATTRKVDYEALKQFITLQKVRVRKSFDRKDTVKPVTASYVGTINDDGTGFLTDPTGNRRFIVISLNSISRAYNAIDVNQLWAQAVSLYRSGEPYELTANEKALQQSVNSRFEYTDPLEDAVKAKYELRGNESITSSEIITYLKTQGNFGNDRQIAVALSKVMMKMGATKGKNTNGITVYRGIWEVGKKLPGGFGKNRG